MNRVLCWPHCLLTVVLLLARGLTGTAVEPADPWPTAFKDLPDHALVRRLEPDPGGPPAARWSTELQALVLACEPRTAAAQPGGAPAPASLLDLAFRVDTPPADAAYPRLTYREETWYGSTFWTGPDWTRVGKDWHHPGEDTPSVRTYHVPRDGRVTVSGPVRKLHLDGDGVRVAIRLGAQTVWQAELEGKDGTGVDPKLTLDVHADDRLRFVVHKRGTIACDTTGWDPVVSDADGTAHRASDSFSTSGQGRGGWYYEMETGTPGEPPAKPLAYYNDLWWGTPYWGAGDWTRVGRNWHHPGENAASVRRFVVPRDGQVTVSGEVHKLHLAGDGVRVTIEHGAREVWRAEIDGDDEEGVEPRLALTVRRGDAVRFIVHKRGGITCDTTYWNPEVRYADGETFRAGDSFGTQQGQGGWYYEMDERERPPSPPPVVHTIGPGSGLNEWPVAAGASVAVTDRECLGWLVVSDGEDASGVWLAVTGAAPWQFEAARTGDGQLRLSVRAPAAAAGTRPVAIGAYVGAWTTALAGLRRLTDPPAGGPAEFAGVGQRLLQAWQAATAGLARPPEPDLLVLAQSEWRREDRVTDDTPAAYQRAVADHLARAQALAADLRAGQPTAFLAPALERGRALAEAAARPEQPLDVWRGLYLQARLLKRDIALANPLLAFDRLLFAKRVPTSYSHLVMQYYGWRARPGGGLFVLDKPGRSLAAHELLAGQLPEGCVLEPRLSYDAREVVFSFVACDATPCDPNSLPVNEQGPDERYYHLYLAGTDGTGLRQLTRGTYDDLMPEFLPDGGIVFCSTRRQGYSRCFGAQFSRRWDSYTLHRVERDGSSLRRLSLNDVSEWFPAVANTGHIVYARWDYIDRDAVTHQNLWATRPDGTNAVAVWGNAAPKPHCFFQPRAIPGSRKIAFIASAHHSVTGGPLCVLDPAVDTNDQRAIARLTPGPYPEAEGGAVPEYYESPWPLSERYFLVAYSPVPLVFEPRPNPANALGLYLLDAAGNRELLYRDPAIGSVNPMPLVPRPLPPALTSLAAADTVPVGEVVMTDVYRGLRNVARGTVRELRIVQVFPKSTPIANSPPIGLAGEENGRAILGTVPVAADGSARFRLPAGKPVLFQALDADGFAVQTMRSLAYVQPGERISCVGCHEPRMTAAPNGRVQALRQPPAEIRPGDLGGRPFSFAEVVQPVLDKQCVRCHVEDKHPRKLDLTGTPLNGFSKAYWTLCVGMEAFSGGGTNPETAAKALVPRFGMRNQVQVTPVGGLYGALGSRWLKMLRAGHHEVSLTPDDLRRLAAWVDLNAIFYGVYLPEDQARQLAGQPVAMPELQ